MAEGDPCPVQVAGNRLAMDAELLGHLVDGGPTLVGRNQLSDLVGFESALYLALPGSCDRTAAVSFDRFDRPFERFEEFCLSRVPFQDLHLRQCEGVRSLRDRA